MSFYVYKLSDPKNSIAGPYDVATAEQAVGFYVKIILRRGYEKRMYFAEDPKIEAEKKRRKEQEAQEQEAERRRQRQEIRRQRQEILRRQKLMMEELERIFERGYCTCGGFIEIEPGLPEPICSCCDGYVIAQPIAV